MTRTDIIRRAIYRSIKRQAKARNAFFSPDDDMGDGLVFDGQISVQKIAVAVADDLARFEKEKGGA